MKLIKPSFEVMTDLSNTWKMLRNIEIIGRVCYKSEDRITDDSAKKFIQRIINSRHHSVIEHVASRAGAWIETNRTYLYFLMT